MVVERRSVTPEGEDVVVVVVVCDELLGATATGGGAGGVLLYSVVVVVSRVALGPQAVTIPIAEAAKTNMHNGLKLI